MWTLLAGAALATPVGPALTPHGCRDPLRSAGRPSTDGLSSLLGARHPVRVWYDPTHANSALIAPQALDAIETAWDVQVDQLGFPPPVLPDGLDGDEFDVYLVRHKIGAAFVAPDGFRYTDAVLGDGRNSTTTYVVVDYRLAEIAVPSYLSHEFNHALQYAIDYSEPTLPIWEGTATAAQDWTMGAAGAWSIDVPSFQEAPHFPALVGDSYDIYYTYGVGYTYEYGAAFWVKFLDEVVGPGDHTAGVRLWNAAANEGAPNEPDVVDAFGATAGLPLGEALNRLALARFLTGDDWDARGLPEAERWGVRYAVPATPLAAGDLVGRHAPSPAPQITGQVFWDLDLTGLPGPVDPDGTTVLGVSAESAAGWSTGLLVAGWRDDGTVFDLGAVDGPLELPTAGVRRVVVALTNLGPPGWDGDDDPYVAGDQTLVVTYDERLPGEPPEDTGLPADTGDPAPADTGRPATDPPPDEPGRPRPEGSGCGCVDAAGPSAAGPAGLAGLALALIARRRRRDRT